MQWHGLVQRDAEHPGAMGEHPRGMPSTPKDTPSQRRPSGSEQTASCPGKAGARAAHRHRDLPRPALLRSMPQGLGWHAEGVVFPPLSGNFSL